MLAARVATAAVLIAALVAALFLLPRTGLAAVIALVTALGAFEWARLCRLRKAPARLYAAAAAAAFCLLALGWNLDKAVFPVAALFWLIVAPAWLAQGVSSAHAKALRVAGFLVVVPAGLAMVALRPQAVLAVLALVWIADTAAYFVGRRWGRRKLAPRVSPGKTWEGAAGGLGGALAYAIICSLLIEGKILLPYLAGAALLAVVSIVGDLFESAVKRQAAVKDSGALLPGHGGVLDRIDSASSALPLAALLVPWVAP